MIYVVKMYECKCDNCGAIFDGAPFRLKGISVYKEKEDCQDEIELSNWHSNGDKHYCTICNHTIDND